MMDPYGSHMPIILRCLKGLHADGNVRTILELGSGFYSTPLLRAYAIGAGAMHRVFESDPRWAKKIGRTMGVNVEVFTEPNLPTSLMCYWDMVLIDSRKNRNRKDYAVQLKPHAQLILLHDSEPKQDYGYQYSKIIDQWEHAVNFKAYLPWTLALTDSDAVAQMLAKIKAGPK